MENYHKKVKIIKLLKSTMDLGYVEFLYIKDFEKKHFKMLILRSFPINNLITRSLKNWFSYNTWVK